MVANSKVFRTITEANEERDENYLRNSFDLSMFRVAYS
jgi:hypothetical protein